MDRARGSPAMAALKGEIPAGTALERLYVTLTTLAQW